MTEVPIYTTESYIGLLCQISHLRNDKVISKDKKETILTLIITTSDALASTIKYRKVKAELDNYDISVATRYIDKTMNSDLLKTFFGHNELSMMEHKLKSIVCEITETTNAIQFDLERLF